MSDPVWEDGDWSGLPPLDGDVTADVCVVGLGGSGLTAVRELRARGIDVVGIEAGTVGGGAAGRNGGFLLAGPADPYDLAVARLGRPQAATLYRRTLEEMDRIEAATPDCVRRTGSLRIEKVAADYQEQARLLRADGFEVQEYDGPEGEGLLFPRDGVLRPLRRCRLLARDLVDRGARLHEGTAALELDLGTVVTARGVIRCGAVLVCVDGGLELLLPELSDRVRTVRLQMLATSPVPQRFSRPVYLRGGYEYWQQLPDGRIALGGFRDVGGDAEETTSTEPSPPVQAALDGLLAQIAPEATVTHRWAASVGYTRDALPYLGQVRQGVWAAGGYCGTGNVVGALCGRQLVSEVLGGETYFG